MANPNVNLFIEQMLANPKAVVQIAFPTGSPYKGNYGSSGVLLGFAEADFGFGMSASYQDTDVGALSNMLNLGVKTLTDLAGAAQRVVHTLQQTLSRYNGTSKPTFTIPITLVKYRESINLADTAAELFAGVTGTFADGGFTLEAPYGYGAASNIGSIYSNIVSAVNGNSNGTSVVNYLYGANAIHGTWAIQIGTWFRATRLVLCDVHMTACKAQVANGSGYVNVATNGSINSVLQSIDEPMYMRFELTFTTAILPSPDIVRGWFIGNTSPSSTANSVAFGGT